MGVSKSFGTNISENHLDNLSAFGGELINLVVCPGKVTEGTILN